MALSLKVAAAVTALATLALTGCEYTGQGIGNPLTRKTAWFSYLSGDDIHKACKPGYPDRYRIVYNGRWEEQVRIYEIVNTPPHTLNQRILGPLQLNHLSIASTDGIGEIFEGQTAQTALGAQRYSELVAAVDQGLATPVPVDKTFASDSFYWIVTACEKGQFRLGAWQYNKPDFNVLTFPPLLLKADATGAKFNEPHEMDSRDFANKSSDDQKRWFIRIYADHIGGAGGF